MKKIIQYPKNQLGPSKWRGFHEPLRLAPGCCWGVSSKSNQAVEVQSDSEPGNSAIVIFFEMSWELKVPTPRPPPPRNQALMFGLIKGNQWLIVPLIRSYLWGGVALGGGNLDCHEDG